MRTKIYNNGHSRLIAFMFFIAAFCNIREAAAQAPEWVWAKSAEGSTHDEVYSVTADPSGSGESYITGYFESPSITFGSTILNNAGIGTGDMFVAKYDAAGNVIWANSAGGTSSDYGKSVTVDLDGSGDIYVVGWFNSSSITFGSTTLNNVGTADLYIVKYDPDGNVIWATSAGGIYQDYAFSVSSDVTGSGDIYVSGSFISPSIIFGSTTLTNAVSCCATDVFIAKYDANGNVIWAKSAGGSSDDEALSVTVSPSDDIYVTGYFTSPVITFGLTTLTSVGGGDMFIVKYDTAGNALWAHSGGGSSYEYSFSITADASDNIYVAGDFYSATVNFDGATLYNASGGSADIFLVKYDSSGNILWANSAGGIDDDVALSVTAKSPGNIYVGGRFNSSSVTFGDTTVTNAGGADMYLVDYDVTGNVVWAKSAGGSSDDYASSVAADAFDNIYAAGWYNSSSITFDSTTLNNVSGGYFDIFLAKIGDTTAAAPVSAFFTSDSTLCEKFCIGFTDQSLNNPVSWLWIFEGGTPFSSSEQNPSSICYNDAGTYDVTLITTNANGLSDTLTLNNYITVYANPFAPIITQSGNTLTSSFATTYQWYLDSNLIPGATDQSYTMTQSGLYTVEISNENSCKSQSSLQAYLVGIDEMNDEFFVKISGNPLSDQLIIEAAGHSTADLELLNVMGEKLYQQTEILNSSTTAFSIDISEIPCGIYFLVIYSGTESKTLKVIKQ